MVKNKLHHSNAFPKNSILLRFSVISFLSLALFSTIAVSAQTNYALAFDGVNDYVTIPNNISATFTLEARIKTTAQSGTGPSAWQGAPLIWSDVTSTTNDFVFSLVNNKLAFDDGSSTNITTVGTTVLNDGNWHHVAVVRTAGSPGTVKLYVDGVLDGSGTAGSSALTANPNIEIGGNTLNSNYFDGYMDEIRVWNAARTATQISTYKNSTLVGNETNLYKYLNLNDGVGGTANNLVANQTDGTLHNMNTAAATSTTSTSGWVFITCPGLWNGTVSTNWATAGNWCDGVVPTSSADVVIPSTAANQPTVSSSVNCKSLTINSGATVTTSSVGTLNITGNITNSGTMTNNGTTNFNGTAQQTFSGVTVFNNLTLNNAAGLLLGGNITINGDLTITAGTLNSNSKNITLNGDWVNNGAFTAGTGTVTFGSTTVISGTTVTNTFNNFTLAASSSVTSSAGITGLVVNGTLNTGSAATLDLGTATILSGTLSTISNTGTIVTSVPATTSVTPIPSGKTWGGTIDYANANGGQTVVVATYNNLTVRPGNGKTTTAGGNLAVNGTLTVTTAYGIFDMSTYVLSGTLSTINIQGDLRTSVPTTTSATPLPAGKTWNGTVYYNAAAGAQTVVGGTYNVLSFSNTSGTNTATGDITITAILKTAAGGTLDMGSLYRLINAGCFSITNNGTIKTSVLTSTSATPLFAGVTWSGTGTIEYAAVSGAQTVVGGTYNNLKLSNTSGTNTAGGGITAGGILTLSGGTITTGANTLYLNSTGTLSRTGGYVIGNFKKYIAAGATAKTFEVGDAGNYTPVTIAFANVTTAGDLTASVTATDHPNLAGSGISTNKSVNRYWTLTNGGIAFTTASLTMNWVAGDVDAGSATANFKVRNYNGSVWSMTSIASPTATSIQATGLTSFGDFAAGELFVTNKYYVNDNSNTGSVYTTAIGNDANAGTTSAPFLTINKAIGVANAGDTIYVDAGSYGELVNPNKKITLLGSNAAISPNTGTRNAESILNNSTGNAVNVSTVNRVVIKGFKMTGNSSYSVISNTSNHKVTLEKNFFDATPGPNFITSDSLLVVDNRFNNLAAGEGFFIAGNYNGSTGTYLEAYDNTWINSSSTGMNIGNAKGDIYNNTFNAVSYYGILVASYSSLNITKNVFTGVINPDVSVNTYGAAVRFYTPTAGMVTNVTNNYFTNNYIGVAVRATDDVTGRTITITNNSFSGNTLANINHTGSGQLNATCNWYNTTNVAAINASVLGNVLYCTFLNNGTDNDLVTAGFQPVPGSCTTPTAAISYTGTPFCSTAATASITFTGNAGGTYSSATLGAALNSVTGAITPASAPAGTHTITYTIPALGGCLAYTTTASVTITTQPNATGTYPASPYCSNAGTISPVGSVTGAIGTFSSAAGLSLDPNYATVNSGASTPGTYTVTYTVPASGGCAIYTKTTPITITAAPGATISYAGSPYCTSGTASVTRTGTAGGTYSSTAGLSLNASTGDANLAASTAGVYTVTYTVAAASPCGQFQTTTSITIAAPGVWTGSVSSSWNVSANWQCSIVPSATTNVTIPTGLSNYPVINIITAAVNNISIQSGANITITNGTLQIAGAASTGGGRITATTGKVEFNGTAAQTVPANLFTSNTLKDLVITNAAGVSLAGTVKVTGTVDFGNVNNSVLASNGYLTLASSATNSANLTDVTNSGVNTGNRVSGDVTVERYIQGKRAYRFLTAPVNSTTSIKANWMEGVNNTVVGVNINPVPNYGTQITGAGGSANGFDPTSTSNPSLFSFNPGGQSWTAVANTAGLFSAGTGFRIMVRGNRSVNLMDNFAASSATTLRATGTLVTGPVTFSAPGGGGTAGMPALTSVTNNYSFIANPYASSVDWVKIYNASANIAPTMYIFDPTINGSNGRGGYVAYNGILKTKNILSSLISNDLQSGQAIFVQTTGPNPLINFQESYKSSTFLPVFRTADDNPHINVELLLPDQVNGTGSADGTAVYFSDEYSSAIGNEDAYKFVNLDENIAILRNGTTLSLEGRKPVTGTDSIPLKIWQLTEKEYTLKVITANFSSNVESYLVDKYLNTTTSLANGENLVPFSITSDAASGATDRFKIVFESFATLPVRLTGIKAYEKNKGVQVDWTAQSESNIDLYEVERSADALHFATIGSSKARNNPAVSAAYTCFDPNPNNGDNYYRIKIIEKSGDTKESEIVRVQIAGTGAISVYPNPVSGNSINLFFNNLQKGSYATSLITSGGQKLYEGTINHTGGSGNYIIKMNSILPEGVYQLLISSAGKIERIAVFVP